MGLAPEQVLAMPLYDYQAAIHFLNRDRAGEDDEEAPLGEDDWEEMQVAMAAQGVN